MTLIELMVVMVIMAAMAAAAAVGLMRSWNTARKHDTATRARTIQAAATAHLLEEGGECPTVEDLARANILDSTTEHSDGWGQAFTIECEETAVHVRSPGPDGTLGTEDDIGF
jgi:prepilin-type N-terminal cleavage/methylation domain-containing protein